MQKIKDFIYFNRKEIILILGFSIFFVFFEFMRNGNNDSEVVLNENIIEKEESKPEKIMIDIKGEVVKPGTYEFNNNERIIDAINISGGLTDHADVSNINLSEKLKDEMIIVIPSKEEITTNQESIKESIKVKEEPKDNRISINTANVSLLMTLSGIGKKKAEAIVEYRQKNGLFKDIKDITKVSGIGNSIFEKIKDYIKV